MFSRLRSLDPELADLVDSGDEEVRRDMLVTAIDFAIDGMGERDPRIDLARAELSAGRLGPCSQHLAVEALADELDETAWGLADAAAGDGVSGEYLRAFAQARLATALALAFAEDALTAAAEGIYECAIAVDDPAALRARLMASFDGGVG